MKNIRQIIALFMAILVLVSTTSFTMNAHFCGGELQNFAFFEAKSCNGTVVEHLAGCENATKTSVEVKQEGCCKDLSVVKSGEDSFTETIVLQVLKPDLKFIAVVVSFLASVSPTETLQQFSNLDGYAPPLIERDIPVLIQSFLL